MIEKEEIKEVKPKVKAKVSTGQQKLIVRTIGTGSDPTRGIFSVEQTDLYINQYIENGWELFSTMFLGNGPIASTWIFAWVLIQR